MVCLAIIIPIGFDIFYLTFINPTAKILNNYTILQTIILAPIAEEAIFRGLLFGVPLTIITLIKKYKNIPNPFIVITTILLLAIQARIFTSYHTNQLDSTLVLGIILGLLFIGHKKLGSQNNLLPPIIAHATHNIAIVILACG